MLLTLVRHIASIFSRTNFYGMPKSLSFCVTEMYIFIFLMLTTEIMIFTLFHWTENVVGAEVTWPAC